MKSKAFMLYVIYTDVDPIGCERLCHFLFLSYVKNFVFPLELITSLLIAFILLSYSDGFSNVLMK